MSDWRCPNARHAAVILCSSCEIVPLTPFNEPGGTSNQVLKSDGVVWVGNASDIEMKRAGSGHVVTRTLLRFGTLEPLVTNSFLFLLVRHLLLLAWHLLLPLNFES